MKILFSVASQAIKEKPPETKTIHFPKCIPESDSLQAILDRGKTGIVVF